MVAVGTSTVQCNTRNYPDSPRNLKVRGPFERKFSILGDGVGNGRGLGLVGS